MNERRLTEKTDLSYSQFHRTQFIRGYFDGSIEDRNRRAAALGMVDIDAVEYCRKCMEPLALVETQRSSYEPKAAAVTRRVAELAGVEAWSMSYRVKNDVTIDEDHEAEIVLFQRRRLWPPGDDRVVVESPCEFAHWLESLRVPHRCAP